MIAVLLFCRDLGSRSGWEVVIRAFQVHGLHRILHGYEKLWTDGTATVILIPEFIPYPHRNLE